MNPQGFMTHQHQPIHREFTSTIQGPRPSPLDINNKTLSSCSSNYSDNNNKNKPVVIYARSPRVFHTSPQDFMALVQSLTGRDPSPTSDKPSKIDGVAHANARTRNVNTASSRLVSPKMIFFSPRKIMSMSDIPLYTPPGVNLPN